MIFHFLLLNRFLEQSALLYPDKVVLICCGNRITYAEIDRASNSLGNTIIETGIKRQDRSIALEKLNRQENPDLVETIRREIG